MDLDYPEDAERFRYEIREWLLENLPEGWTSPGFSLSKEEKRIFYREWTKRLFSGGWICAAWPEEYGGKGLTLIESVVLNEEFARVQAPLRADFMGDTLVGPTILHWGSEALKTKFIPDILNGTITWCQGFSEPDAGSDLASLRRELSSMATNGSSADRRYGPAPLMMPITFFSWLGRTKTAPKHRGISFLLVPMKQGGIEVRPIEQIDGSAAFNEVFFNDARCPRDHVVGDINVEAEQYALSHTDP